MTPTDSTATAGPEVAVVGGAGFIGSALCRSFAANAVLVESFTRHRPAVTAGRLAVELGPVGTVYLLAGRVNPALAERDPAAVTAELVDLRCLLELLSEAPAQGRIPSRRVVLAGSGGTVYDPRATPPYAEDATVAPVNAYGRLKLATEDLLRSFSGPLDPVVARLSNVYGPGQRLGTGQGVIGHWLAAARGGLPLQLFGDPATTRDYLYIDDAVDALRAVHSAPSVPPVLNVGSGSPTSLAALADLLRTAVGRPDLELTVAPARGFDRQDTWLDITLARGSIGWSPRTGLAEGLLSTWQALHTA